MRSLCLGQPILADKCLPYHVHKVGLKSNETERVARQVAKQKLRLRHQPRRTFLLDDQGNFQLDSFNKSELTAGFVCVQ